VKFRMKIPTLRRPSAPRQEDSPRRIPSGRLIVLLAVAVGAPTLIAGANFIPQSPFYGQLNPVLAPVRDLLWHPSESTVKALDNGEREARLARARERLANPPGAPVVVAGGPAVPASSPGGPVSEPAVAAMAIPTLKDTVVTVAEAAAESAPVDSAEVPMSAAVALDRGPDITYAGGGRDPFRSLLLATPDFSLLDLEAARLVGVAWNHQQMVAMIEDKRGRNWSLREGDHVQNGRLIRVSANGAVFDTWLFGNSERKVLELIPKEEESQP